MTPETEFLLGPLTSKHPYPWADMVAHDVGLQRGRDYPVNYDADTSVSHWTFFNYYYYDLARVLYTEYYRTGETEFQTLARKVADSWWTQPLINSGARTIYDMSPRDSAIGGLILRALDGRSEFFDFITRYVDWQYKSWILDRIDSPRAVPGGTEATQRVFLYDVREPGYMMIYAASLAKVHPDPARRDLYKQQLARGVNELFAVRQRPDGALRYYHPDIGLTETESVFTNGLLLEGIVLAHRLNIDSVTTANAKSIILKGVDHLTAIYRNDPVLDVPGVTWRGYPNRWGGGDINNPTVCEQPLGCRDYGHNPPGVLSVPSETEDGGLGYVREARQYATMILHAYGYAYELTGDQKYKAQGDEIQDACFGKTKDQFVCYADAPSTPKCYPQAFRSSLTYPARVATTTVIPPAQTRTLTQPSNETKWNTLLDNQWTEGYRLKKFLAGPNVLFEKVKP